MSILIKGIKKPKRCSGFDGSKCPFWDDEDNCVLQELIDGTWDDLYANCPIVELPEKHGRLIDGDELFKQMNTAIAMMSGMMKAIGAEDDEGMQMELKAYRDIRDGIKDCDTVIKAEGEE